MRCAALAVPFGDTTVCGGACCACPGEVGRFSARAARYALRIASSVDAGGVVVDAVEVGGGGGGGGAPPMGRSDHASSAAAAGSTGPVASPAALTGPPKELVRRPEVSLGDAAPPKEAARRSGAKRETRGRRTWVECMRVSE